MSENTGWQLVAQRAQNDFARPKKRVRSFSAVLAILVQVGMLLIWILETRIHAAHHHGGGERLVSVLMWAPNASSIGTIHPNAHATPTAKPTVTEPQKSEPVVPPVQAPLLSEPVWVLRSPLQMRTPEEPKKPEPVPEQAPAMTPKEIEEFKRQWAQLSNDMTHKAMERAEHHNLDVNLKEPKRAFAADSLPEDDPDKRPDARKRPSAANGNLFDGELCVSRAGPNGELALALPCIGEGYHTDYGWETRVHAPKRGEPMPASVDPSGRVAVRQHEFKPETVAAFQQAQAELYKIQVTMRMVYLPELSAPIQLLSRDDRAGAISVQAFPSEKELTDYLNEWAGNVRRWTSYRGEAAQR